MQPIQSSTLFFTGRGDLPLRHDVRDGEPAARLQDPERLAEDAVLVGREVDDAVRDDDVDGVVGERDLLHRPLQELDVRRARLRLVLAGEGEHLVGHVEAVGLARRADPLRREEDVDAAAGAEVEDDLPLLELREGGRVAAAERGLDGRRREELRLVVGVEVRGDRVAGEAGGRRGRAAAGDGAGPQQLARPSFTCRAALPYFSLTTSRISLSFMAVSFLSRILDTFQKKKGFSGGSSSRRRPSPPSRAPRGRPGSPRRPPGRGSSGSSAPRAGPSRGRRP